MEAGGRDPEGKPHAVVTYYALAVLISWLMWSPLVAHRFGLLLWPPPAQLHLLGGFGPLLAALLTEYHREGTAGVRRWVQSGFRVWGQWRWILLGIVAPALLFLASGALAVALGKGPIPWNEVARSEEYPMSRAAYAAATFVSFGLGEEAGWRGFAQPQLQRRFSPLVSALIVGLLWASWHLPLFAFAEGFSRLGMAGVGGWLFSLMTGSVLLAWIFNASGGSILAVAAFHGALDLFMGAASNPAITSIMGASITLWGVWALRMLRARHASEHNWLTD